MIYASQMPKKQPQKQQHPVRVKIEAPDFRLELEGEKSLKYLKDIRQLMAHMSPDFYPDGAGEDELDHFFYHQLSKELFTQKAHRELLNNYAQQYPAFRIRKTSVENASVIEVGQSAGKSTVKTGIEQHALQKACQHLLFKVPKQEAKAALVHVKGSIPPEEAEKIFDKIEREFSNITLKKIHTKAKKHLPHTLVEAVFFGNFEEEMME